jgi:ribosome-associated toxin RatA of RatAB toxin-antitoxin module
VKDVFTATLLLVTLAQPVTGPKLTDDETKKLDKGEIVTRETTPTGGKGVGAMALGVIEAPSAEVWEVLRDCQRYWQFMPRTKKSWFREEEGVGTICHVELQMPFPLPNLWSDTVAEIREEPKGHFLRAWKMVRGSYRRNDGSWTIIPWGDGSRSLVVYDIDTDPLIAVPDPLIRLGQAGSLPDVITQIRKRVVALRPAVTTAPGSK